MSLRERKQPSEESSDSFVVTSPPDSRNRLFKTEGLYSNTELYGVRSEYYQGILDHTACALSRAYGSKQVRILDILPGEGDYLVGLGQRLDHLSLTAFELSPEVRDRILLKLRCFAMEGCVNFLLKEESSDKWKIPSMNESFDCVTCFNRLNLINDPLALLSEMRRVLKTGGLLVFTNVNRLSLGGMNMTLHWRRRRRLSSGTQLFYDSVKPISYRTMVRMLGRNGLEIKYSSGLGVPRAYYYRLLGRIFSKLGNPDKGLRYEYRQVSNFWEPSSFWSNFANVNFIIAIKVK